MDSGAYRARGSLSNFQSESGFISQSSRPPISRGFSGRLHSALDLDHLERGRGTLADQYGSCVPDVDLDLDVLDDARGE